MIMSNPPAGERIVLHPLPSDDRRRRVHADLLTAWARVNQLPIAQLAVGPTKPIVVLPDAELITYWSLLPDLTSVRATRSMTIRPTGALTGAADCGAMTRLDDDPTIYVCTMRVNDGLQHYGPHADTQRGNTTWPNPHPARPSLPDVGHLTPAGQHTHILAALQEAQTRTGADTAGLRGRRAILERHQPGLARVSPRNLHWCADHLHQDADLSFPCPDYRDAAAGLVNGLEAT